jgi:hypothetical protein
MVNATAQPLYPRVRDPVAIVQEAGWGPGLVWMVMKISPQLGLNPQTTLNPDL